MRDIDLIQAELAQRELSRRSYAEYLAYVHGALWKRTRMSTYLANEVQKFVMTETGNAYDILVIATPPQHGKECADSTPVPTPTGWKRHGDLRKGDYVFSPEGKPIRVLAEIPQEEPASLLVTFIDGAQIKVHPNHEWVVYDRRRKEWATIETKEMLRRGLHEGSYGRGGHYLFSVAEPKCIEYKDADLDLHPYFLGLWLGDGSTTKPCITHSPKDLEPVNSLIELGYNITSQVAHKETGVLTTYFFGKGYEQLKALDMGHVNGKPKHIPEQYKIASVEQRLELLAGLIDSDGYVYKRNGRVTISNANRTLIEDIAEVVRSLGWTATIASFEPCTSSSGIEGKQTVYQLSFNPDMEIPCALPRKRGGRITPAKHRRAIVSIEPCEPEHGKCITVEGGVYLVGEHFTPTHNSMTLSESLPSWYFTKFPHKRVIMASYNEDTAAKFCRRNSDKITRFGNALAGISIGSVNKSTEFELSNGVGRLISRGIMSGITGNPADLIIIDDPIKNREEADSEAIRAKLWSEWQNSLKSRLAAGAKVILIMTPWHEDDMRARLLNSEKNVRYIRLPVEAEENDPLGRKPGEPLCPELGKDMAWLIQFRESYVHDPNGGSRAWQALYQCSPRVEGGNIVDRSWWRFYRPQDVTQFGTELISVDATFKGTDASDYVAITVWGKRDNDYYLRYCLNRHLSFTQTLEALRLAQTLYPTANRVLVEDKANGSAIIDVLSREMFCIPVTPKGGKESRVNAVSPAIEAGHVYLPEGAPWLEAYIDQWSSFPAGAHDDMVDSSTQALSYLFFSNGIPASTKPNKQLEQGRQAQRAFLDNDTLYDVYGVGAPN